MRVEEAMTREIRGCAPVHPLNRAAQLNLDIERTALADDLSLKDFSGAILPGQYFDLINRRKCLDGERRLLFAVLEDAVRTYLTNMKGCSRERRIRFIEVRRWFYSPSDRGLFAFESICELLGITPGIFRRRLSSISLFNLPSCRLRRISPIAYRGNHTRRRQHAESKHLSRSRKSRTARMRRAVECDMHLNFKKGDGME